MPLEKERKMEQKAVEQELGRLLEATLRWEDELNSISF
jgi:hypothetical protein